MSIIIYSYFRSSCSARVRIALHLKDLSYETVPVNLLKGEQLSEEHRKLNPSGSVPLLVINAGMPTEFKISQSVAALEYLEEAFPGQSILPPASDHAARATVRALVDIVCCDIQPVTNLRIMNRVRKLGGVAEDWNRELMEEGLRAYESVVADVAGKYSVGDTVTMADCCLVPAVWNAQRLSLDIEQFPTISRIVENMQRLEAVVNAHYFSQPDTPEDLRSGRLLLS
jgi:maleylacetoacetate isomerase